MASVITGLYTDLTNLASQSIAAKYIFLGERPKESTDDGHPLPKFIVAELPADISDFVSGYKKTCIQTEGVFYLFCKGKSNNTLNVNAMGSFVDLVMNSFPYVGDYCSCIRPHILSHGADEYGYHYTTISFDIQAKTNAFD